MVALRVVEGDYSPDIFPNPVANYVIKELAKEGNAIRETHDGQYYLEFASAGIEVPRPVVAALLLAGYVERKQPSSEDIRASLRITDKGRSLLL